MALNVEIPSDITPGSADHVRAVNRSLRRLAEAIAAVRPGTSTTNTTIVQQTGGGAAAVQAVLTVPGNLGVQADAAPRLSLSADQQARQLVAEVKRAPVGASLKLALLLDSDSWATMEIPDGQTRVEASALALPKIVANRNIRLDITQAGTTFPGSDLTVMIRF